MSKLTTVVVLATIISLSTGCTSRGGKKKAMMDRLDSASIQEYTMNKYLNESITAQFIVSSECVNILYYDTIEIVTTRSRIEHDRNMLHVNKTAELDCYDLDIKTVVK